MLSKLVPNKRWIVTRYSSHGYQYSRDWLEKKLSMITIFALQLKLSFRLVLVDAGFRKCIPFISPTSKRIYRFEKAFRIRKCSRLAFKIILYLHVVTWSRGNFRDQNVLKVFYSLQGSYFQSAIRRLMTRFESLSLRTVLQNDTTWRSRDTYRDKTRGVRAILRGRKVSILQEWFAKKFRLPLT